MKIGQHFEKLIGDLFYSYNLTLKDLRNNISDNQFLPDFIIETFDSIYIIEVKYNRSDYFPITLVNQSIHLLENYAKHYTENKNKKIRTVLITSSLISHNFYCDIVNNPENAPKTEIIDQRALLELVKNDNFLSEFLNVVSSIPQDISLEYHYYTGLYYLEEQSFYNLLLNQPHSLNNEENKSYIGNQLCQQLKKLNPGKEDAYKYEDLIEKIISFLFAENIDPPKKQISSSDEINRYDLISRIKIHNYSFWEFIKDRLNCQYIIFECKNYTKEIKQGQILTTEKYLFPKALRSVSIIFTRIGADDNAIKMAEGALRENGKLILVVTDEHVCEMLHAKDNANDPSDILFNLADEFFMRLNR